MGWSWRLRPYAREVGGRADAQGAQLGGRADAGQQQQLR